MTRRELINALLDGDMNDEMFVAEDQYCGWSEAFPIKEIDNDVLIFTKETEEE